MVELCLVRIRSSPPLTCNYFRKSVTLLIVCSGCRAAVHKFTNVEMCRITEELIFQEPYEVHIVIIS